VCEQGVSSEKRKACGWWWCSPAEPASLSSRRPANVSRKDGESANESGKVYTKRMSSSYETSVKATVLTSDSVAKSTTKGRRENSFAGEMNIRQYHSIQTCPLTCPACRGLGEVPGGGPDVATALHDTPTQLPSKARHATCRSTVNAQRTGDACA